MEKKLLEVRYNPQEGVVVCLHPFHRLPSQTSAYLRNAGKEFLLAFRSLVDIAISLLEEEHRPSGPRKIEVKEQGESCSES